MASEAIRAIEQRDRAMQKLRDLTWTCFLWAAGMVAVFSVIAAATVPGQSQTNSNRAPSSDPSNSWTGELTDGGQLQPPANGSFQSGGGSPPLVVSGASH